MALTFNAADHAPPVTWNPPWRSCQSKPGKTPVPERSDGLNANSRSCASDESAQPAAQSNFFSSQAAPKDGEPPDPQPVP